MNVTDSYGVAWLGSLCPSGLAEIWTPMYNVRLERELWVTVMEIQQDLGLDISDDQIAASTFAYAHPAVDCLESIRRREQITRHDVKARLEIFAEESGHERIHLGMTSADVVDNCMQIKMLRSGQWLEDTHGVHLPWVHRYSMRGIKGAVGTQQDQLDLLGSEAACLELDRRVAEHFGFDDVMLSTGQVYPRSQDLEVLSGLCAAALSASHHNPFIAVVSGYMQMAALYGGDQWNEGDVSTSVIRRVCLPGAFLATHLALVP